jgi:tRNA nucleotidyltransferase (CCA-adding enzyme)
MGPLLYSRGVTDAIQTIAAAVGEAGGRALVVGGWVRDRLLGHRSKDVDVEVYGLDPATLKRLLKRLGRVNAVGESFTVYKVQLPGGRDEVDVSIPRRESKTGRGHRGFTVEGDPTMTVEEAARRRDFTINAILYDPLAGEIIDPFGGAADLEARRLRVVDPETFVEDSLRVLRAAQFAARFRLTLDPATVALCRRIDLSDLPAERVWGEVEKLLRAEDPSIGLEALRELGVLPKLFPELEALVGCQQRPDYHPEGDVWTHTKLVVDEAADLVGELSRTHRTTVMLAALCHDLGKPPTTAFVGGKWRSRGHDVAGIEPTERMLDRLNVHTLDGYDVRRQTIALVAEHLTPRNLYIHREAATEGAFRRLALRVDCRLLYFVAKADALGRTGTARDATAQDWFIERVRELGLESGAPAPLLLGRHVLELGVAPGPEVGRVTKAVYELQLDGEVRDLDAAIAAARRLVATA